MHKTQIASSINICLVIHFLASASVLDLDLEGWFGLGLEPFGISFVMSGLVNIPDILHLMPTSCKLCGTRICCGDGCHTVSLPSMCATSDKLITCQQQGVIDSKCQLEPGQYQYTEYSMELCCGCHVKARISYRKKVIL